jgi:hypothetical protein
VHVVYPLLSLGVLFGAALWACGSLVLPWIVRGRRFAIDAVLVSMWAGALAATEPLLDSGPGAHRTLSDPRGLLGSSIVAALLAIGARALRGPD